MKHMMRADKKKSPQMAFLFYTGFIFVFTLVLGFAGYRFCMSGISLSPLPTAVLTRRPPDARAITSFAEKSLNSLILF